MKKEDILIDLKTNLKCLKIILKVMMKQRDLIKKVEEFNCIDKECNTVDMAINTLNATIFLLK
jgi:hypothetical protein